MAIVYVDKDKFKIFKKKPRYGKTIGRTRGVTYFTFTTDNEDNKMGVVASKGYQLRYD